MHGRSCACLLTLIALVAAPAALCGQNRPDSNRSEAPREDPPGPLGYTTQLPIVEPVFPEPVFPQPGSPRRWPEPNTPVSFGLPQLARSAGTIFSGTVTGIVRRPAARGRGVETVEVTFRVENAIRGTTQGATLTFYQWIALWSAGQRYRVGERLLLFLYHPSKLGLTSCVAGPMGRFAVDPAGRVALTAQHLAAFRRDPVLGGKSRVSLRDFALAVSQATEEE